MTEDALVSDMSEWVFVTLLEEVSDEALELAAGDSRGLFCSCDGCNSACSQGSR